LEIYRAKKIESTFIEIINSKGKNIIIGCIYKHHTIIPKEFTQEMSMLLTKLSKENKPCYLAGDFNMNLLHLETKPEIENYFDVMTNQNFTPLITYPTRITSKSKTLIDNIFFNEFSSDIVSGNQTVGLSDHIPQFALIPNKILKSSTNNKTP
jgi:endonuclease/exonuclease/phosphatase family metal-dependent hydrolase